MQILDRKVERGAITKPARLLQLTLLCSLGWNKIGGEGAKGIGEGLEVNASLTEL